MAAFGLELSESDRRVEVDLPLRTIEALIVAPGRTLVVLGIVLRQSVVDVPLVKILLRRDLLIAWILLEILDLVGQVALGELENVSATKVGRIRHISVLVEIGASTALVANDLGALRGWVLLDGADEVLLVRGLVPTSQI